MFLDPYKILEGAECDHTDYDHDGYCDDCDEEIEYDTAEAELEDELSDVEDADEDIAHTVDEVPVVTDEAGSYMIDCQSMLKYMSTNGIYSVKEAFENISEANDLPMIGTYLLLSEAFIEDDIASDALRFIKTLKESGIDILVEAKKKDDDKDEDSDDEDKDDKKKDDKEDEDEDIDLDDDSDDEDEDSEDDDSDDKKKKDKKDDDEDDDEEDDDDKDSKKSDKKDEKKDDKKTKKEVKDELEDVEEGAIAFNAAMVPVNRGITGSYFVEHYYLQRYMNDNNITSVSEAMENIAIENVTESGSIFASDLILAINPMDITESTMADTLAMVRSAKNENVQLVKLTESVESKIAKVDKKIAKAKAKLEKVKANKKWWNSLSTEEQKKETNKARFKYVISEVGIFISTLAGLGGVMGAKTVGGVAASIIASALGMSTSSILGLLSISKKGVSINDSSLQDGIYDDAIKALQNAIKYYEKEKKELQAKK